MLVYFITIFILFAFSLHELISNNIRKKKILLYFSYLLLVVVVGLRWETGTDWDAYLNVFSTTTSLQDVFLSPMEKGFLLSNYFVNIFTDSYSFYLLLHAILFYYLIIKSFSKITQYPQLTLMLFFASTLGMMGSSRQLLAVALCLYGLSYLIENKKIHFILYVVSSFFFHTTSLLFSAYFFLNRKIKDIYLYLAVAIAFFIGKTQIPLTLFSLFGEVNQYAADKTDAYLEGAKEELMYAELSLVGLIKRLLFLFIFIYLRGKIEKRMPHYNLLLNGYVVGIAFYFLFSTTLLVMVSRGSFYFNLMDPLLLSSILYTFRRDVDKLVYLFILLFLAILLMYQSTVTYPDLFDPYKGVFINTYFNRYMY